MTEKITLKAQRFNKEKFNETVNKEFTQLVNTPDPSFFDRDLANIDDFWYLYDKFFYIIPKLGDIESHQYLAKTSGEYADFATISNEIQALLDEIAELRRENLNLIQEATNLEDAIDPNEVNNNLTFSGTGRNNNVPEALNENIIRG
jgi:hypothetical protein|tara:strand:- start:191 stop:631 length:441 start_codon:yes stop_codon:yes gene_type:complete